MDERKVYTFVVPARRGHYYVAVLAEDYDEAEERVLRSPQLRDVEEREGMRTLEGEGIVPLGEYSSVDEVVIDKAFKNRLERFGIAHKFVHRALPPISEGYGVRPDLPEKRKYFFEHILKGSPEEIEEK